MDRLAPSQFWVDLSIILLNDKNIALELLEKRSSIHSGRPDLKFAFDMCGWSEPTGQLPNGDRHLFYRKYVYKQLGSKTAISKYNSLQEAMVGRTLWRIKQNRGKDLSKVFKVQTGGPILSLLYDYNIDPHTSADHSSGPCLGSIQPSYYTWQMDFINGYHIPKGCILLANEWRFMRDPEFYHDPESFKPERYMEPYHEPSPGNCVFGFGRRVCPGRVLAESNLFFACAQVLAVFDIRPALGDDGKQAENLHTFSAGLIAQLGPFGVDVTPRSETHAVMIEQLMEKYPWEDSNSNDLVGLNDNSW